MVIKRFQLINYSVYFIYSYHKVVIVISSWYFINIRRFYVNNKRSKSVMKLFFIYLSYSLGLHKLFNQKQR
jgi:hypothetical protein